jgi:hypothetical protein
MYFEAASFCCNSFNISSLDLNASETDRTLKLNAEAARFFQGRLDDHEERKAFEKANLKSWTRK